MQRHFLDAESYTPARILHCNMAVTNSIFTASLPQRTISYYNYYCCLVFDQRSFGQNYFASSKKK